MEEIVVLEPLAFSVPDVYLDSRPMAGKMDRKPLEHAVPEEDLDSTPMEEIVVLEPLPLRFRTYLWTVDIWQEKWTGGR